MIYLRGQREDYADWAADGAPGWAWKDVLPYFIRSEGNQRGASATHGADGPLACSDICAKHELIEAIIAGADELGVPRTDDFNGGVQEGAGYYQLFTKKGLRCSSAVGYLRPARSRANLAVEVDAQATRILFERWRAAGVECRQGGEIKRASVRHEVILAAGSLQSPQLLQLSGIGPAHLLRQFAIPVVHDLPGVGENLHDHLQVRLLYKCTADHDQRRPGLDLALGEDRLAMVLRPHRAAGSRHQPGRIVHALLPDRPRTSSSLCHLSADLASAKPHPFRDSR
jgi:choline dehydrogenase